MMETGSVATVAVLLVDCTVIVDCQSQYCCPNNADIHAIRQALRLFAGVALQVVAVLAVVALTEKAQIAGMGNHIRAHYEPIEILRTLANSFGG